VPQIKQEQLHQTQNINTKTFFFHLRHKQKLHRAVPTVIKFEGKQQQSSFQIATDWAVSTMLHFGNPETASHYAPPPGT